MKRTANRLVRFLAAMIVAVVAGELTLRALSNDVAWFDWWYTPGVHSPSKQFGFVFTPNYAGIMRHPEGVFGEPIHLDRHGFRMPAQTDAKNPGKQVVLIGGRSMMFCYGLPDDQTVGTTTALASKQPITTTVVSWPGFPPKMSYEVYQTFLEPEIKPAVVVLCLYPGDPDGKMEFQDPSIEAMNRSKPIPFARPGLVLPPEPRPIREAFGQYQYSSYLLFGLLRQADIQFYRIQQAMFRLKITRPPEQPAAQFVSPGLSRMNTFVKELDHHFKEKGSRFMVVFIPREHFAADNNDMMVKAMPEGVHCADLHKELAPVLTAADYQAGEHYGPHAAQLIGAALAREIDNALQATP